jgi:toxic protein SymE
VFHGFPWADISIVGSSVVVTTENGDHALAKRVGKLAGDWIWSNKERFAVHVKEDGQPNTSGDPLLEADVHAAQSALAAAKRWIADGQPGPVCVNETADNTGCGAPGDATHLLRAMLAAGPWAPGEAAFGWIYDPETLAQAIAAGVGSKISVRLGGKLDTLAGAPIVADDVLIKVLTDGKHTASIGSVGEGTMRNLGPMARLLIGGIDVLVNASRQQSFDEGALYLAGIAVDRCSVIGIKSSTHFRGGWTPCSGKIITAESPGSSSNVLANFGRTVPVVRWPTSDEARYVGGSSRL